MQAILVTGANKGIGRAIAHEILSKHDDTVVYLGSRDAERGRVAIAEMIESHPEWRERLRLQVIDVCSDESVTAAATEVAAALGPDRLYGLVNNAGIGFGAGDLTTVLGVNAYGVRRVCEAFLPLLEPKSGRIVNITSAAGPNYVNTCGAEKQAFLTDPEVTWERLDALMQDSISMAGDASAFQANGLGNGQPYGLSKACANSYTLLLAKQTPWLHINACTPGFIETDLTRPYAQARGKTPADMGMKPPSQGTRSALHLLFGELEGNGRYYGSDAVRSPFDRYRAPGDPAYTGN